MKEDFTRIDLVKAGNGLSDWTRLAAMQDSALDRAITNDPDTFGATDGDVYAYASTLLPKLAIALRRGRLRRWARPLRRSEERAFAIG